jgi:hypothetical protein
LPVIVGGVRFFGAAIEARYTSMDSSVSSAVTCSWVFQ